MHDDFDLLMTVHYPDDLAEAFGYNSDARYVGFYWDHAGDELTWLDGRRSLCGAECQYFIKFASLHQINKHRIGDSDTLPTNYLLVDRKSNNLYVGDKRLVEEFLKLQWSPIQS